MNKKLNPKHKLLVTIVKKGMAQKVVKASKKAGAEGATIIYGRGNGIHDNQNLLGFSVDTDKEVIFTLMSKEKMDAIITAVENAGKLDKPGSGIGFVVDVKRFAGIVHLLKSQD
ncbi:P-II family nitrogen regulator [Alkalihalophilus pseudofirmus]|uniref:P-II family nitrogen regulator n=1 Tax=Alkalihalophilus pseudofirmus TaxID=79885 RepID=UPI00259B0E1B|nr:P-II family nitrogen regulator [Alkalihalophilus pseudofirmus]WEG17272.1 P-II family nitrogen regulator [Alkalihalophilus pseudofirmus]